MAVSLTKQDSLKVDDVNVEEEGDESDYVKVRQGCHIEQSVSVPCYLFPVAW